MNYCQINPKWLFMVGKILIVSRITSHDAFQDCQFDFFLKLILRPEIKNSKIT